MKDGIYNDPADEVDLQTLHDHYGVTRRRLTRLESETGAGNDEGEEEREDEIHARVIRAIGQGQQKQVRHPPVEVPEATNPFMSDIQETAFFRALNLLQDEGQLPEGFDLHGNYEPTEVYKTGRSRKGLKIPLPHSLWFPRIVLWCHAITLLKRLSIIEQE